MRRHTWCNDGVEYGLALMCAVLASSGMISDLCAIVTSSGMISDLCDVFTFSGMTSDLCAVLTSSGTISDLCAVFACNGGISDFSTGMMEGHSMSCTWSYITVLITLQGGKSKHRAFVVPPGASRGKHMLLTMHYRKLF